MPWKEVKPMDQRLMGTSRNRSERFEPKAHELNHSGAMAQLMQRRAGVFHAQDGRSRLVQRLPGLGDLSRSA